MLVFTTDTYIFNNLRCAFFEKQKVKQELFNVHFTKVSYDSEDNWDVMLVDHDDIIEKLRKRKSFQQHELNTFLPNELNESEVTLFIRFNLSLNFSFEC